MRVGFCALGAGDWKSRLKGLQSNVGSAPRSLSTEVDDRRPRRREFYSPAVPDEKLDAHSLRVARKYLTWKYMCATIFSNL